MSYKTYENYKDSNLSYVGEIPINWEIGRVKHILDYNHHYPVGDGDHGSIKPEMYQDEGIPYIRVQNLSWGFDLNLENIVYISNEVNNQNKKSILKPKDILIAKTGATVGKLAIIPSFIPQANTTSSVGKITVNHDLFNYKYYAYLFLSNMFRHQIIEAASQKSAQPGFNIDDLIEFNILIPPKDEQNKIVSYLDKKNSIINRIIEKNKELVYLLEEKKVSLINQVVTKGLDHYVPMKDSGIEWVDEIPEHWKIKRLKNVSDVIMGQSPSSEDINYDGEGIYFMQGNAEFGSKYPEPTSFCTNPKKISRKGDILMSVRAPVGALNISDKRYCIGRGLCSIKSVEILSSYLWYFLIYSKSYLDFFSNGSTFDAITVDTLLNLPICLPPSSEQEQIVNYLDNEIPKIDETISKIWENIDLLNEYKASLIYHVVTGKIDVRDEV